MNFEFKKNPDHDKEEEDFKNGLLFKVSKSIFLNRWDGYKLSPFISPPFIISSFAVRVIGRQFMGYISYFQRSRYNVMRNLEFTPLQYTDESYIPEVIEETISLGNSTDIPSVKDRITKYSDLVEKNDTDAKPSSKESLRNNMLAFDILRSSKSETHDKSSLHSSIRPSPLAKADDIESSMISKIGDSTTKDRSGTRKTAESSSSSSFNAVKYGNIPTKSDQDKKLDGTFAPKSIKYTDEKAKQQKIEYGQEATSSKGPETISSTTSIREKSNQREKKLSNESQEIGFHYSRSNPQGDTELQNSSFQKNRFDQRKILVDLSDSSENELSQIRRDGDNNFRRKRPEIKIQHRKEVKGQPVLKQPSSTDSIFVKKDQSEIGASYSLDLTGNSKGSILRKPEFKEKSKDQFLSSPTGAKNTEKLTGVSINVNKLDIKVVGNNYPTISDRREIRVDDDTPESISYETNNIESLNKNYLWRYKAKF